MAKENLIQGRTQPIHKRMLTALTTICLAIVKQGNHKARIVEYLRVLRACAKVEFREDNQSSLDAFLEECWAESRLLTPTGPRDLIKQWIGIYMPEEQTRLFNWRFSEHENTLSFSASELDFTFKTGGEVLFEHDGWVRSERRICRVVVIGGYILRYRLCQSSAEASYEAFLVAHAEPDSSEARLSNIESWSSICQ